MSVAWQPEPTHCACFNIGLGQDGSPLISWSDLYAIYMLPDGSKWAEHGYFFDMDDLVGNIDPLRVCLAAAHVTQSLCGRAKHGQMSGRAARACSMGATGLAPLLLPAPIRCVVPQRSHAAAAGKSWEELMAGRKLQPQELLKNNSRYHTRLINIEYEVPAVWHSLHGGRAGRSRLSIYCTSSCPAVLDLQGEHP